MNNAVPSGSIRIVIDGPPVAKGRPRMSKNGHVHTPEKTRTYESHGRVAAQLAMDGLEPLHGAVGVSVEVLLPIPESWPKSRKQAALCGHIWPTTKPDADNYAKCALDLANKIVWDDDSQVVSLYVNKRYDADPRMIIEVVSIYG